MTVVVDIRGGQVDGEETVVLGDGGVQKYRAAAIFKTQFEARQVARIFVVDSLFPVTDGLNIAEAVKDCKTVAVLESSGAVIQS